MKDCNNHYCTDCKHCLALQSCLDLKRSSGWLESWEGLLFVTEVSKTCAEAIFWVKQCDWPITSCIYQYQRLLYLSANQITHQGFWVFNWLKLSLDSEDGFCTGCQNISHKQQSLSGLQSPRWSFSIKVCYSWVQTIFSNTIFDTSLQFTMPMLFHQ